MITRTAVGLAALVLLGMGVISPAVFAQNISACPTTISASGTYTVTANLTATGTCITITAAADVAIDLHGHTITGNSTGNAGIIDANNGCSPSCQQNIIIANGTIKGFSNGSGIILYSTEYATIANMNVKENLDGITFYQDYQTVFASQTNKNEDTGMEFLESSNNTVTNSQANRNGGGMDFYYSSNNTVANSQANSNGGDGISSVASTNNTIINSQANGNGAGWI